MSAQPETDWMEDAECLGVNPNIFFPERGQSLEPAKAYCRRCPVVAECLEHALDVGEKHGIFGNTSGDERRRIRSIRAKGRTTTAQRLNAWLTAHPGEHSTTALAETLKVTRQMVRAAGEQLEADGTVISRMAGANNAAGRLWRSTQ